MITVYVIENKISESVYVGITNKTKERRFKEHLLAAKHGRKTPLYDAIRSYGPDAFEVEEFGQVEARDVAGDVERQLISAYSDHTNVYNLLPGGDYCGFYIKDVDDWKAKLRTARAGKTPALGMKHSDENKALAARVSREYWDTQETYDPQAIVGLTHREAKAQLGISTTHYYRLRKKLAGSHASS